MAYMQAALTPLFRLRINEPGRHFTVLSSMATWHKPEDNAMYVNHKSATKFDHQATELEFYGRLNHKHAVALVRESDRQMLALVEVSEHGVVAMRHASAPITRSAMINPRNEHIAIMVAFPNELFTMCIFDNRHSDTDLIRYRPLNGRFYIPSQYLEPDTRVTMATRNNAIMQIARDAANEQAGPSGMVNEAQATPESQSNKAIAIDTRNTIANRIANSASLNTKPTEKEQKPIKPEGMEEKPASQADEKTEEMASQTDETNDEPVAQVDENRTASPSIEAPKVEMMDDATE